MQVSLSGDGRRRNCRELSTVSWFPASKIQEPQICVAFARSVWARHAGRASCPNSCEDTVSHRFGLRAPIFRRCSETGRAPAGPSRCAAVSSQTALRQSILVLPSGSILARVWPELSRLTQIRRVRAKSCPNRAAAQVQVPPRKWHALVGDVGVFGLKPEQRFAMPSR